VAFSYDVKELEGYAYGLFYPENKTWTGLMGDLQNGDADMTGCEISVAANRLDYADFSTPIQMIG
jgi:Ligated ion channel L-glutamate- and glycine-binding site